MKKTPLKKKAASHTSSWYRKKCVGVAKILAKERDGYICQRCGKSKEAGYRIEGSHVFPEGRYHGLSADPENIKALCSDCHIWWWHAHPTEAGVWFKEKYPERYAYLLELSRTTIKKDWKKEYEAMRMQLP